MNKKPKFPERRLVEVKNLATYRPNDSTTISLIGKALSSPLRIQILNILQREPVTLTELAHQLKLPISTAAFNLDILENAGLITIDLSPQSKGHIKWFSYNTQEVRIRLVNLEDASKIAETDEQIIHIGDYIDGEFDSYCGIASEKEHFFSDRPKDVFLDKRDQAQLIWTMPTGSLTYAVRNSIFQKGQVSSIQISLELCSEANGYNKNFPSDITFWINGIEIGTWTSPGDFGDRYGKYTPDWWYPESTKYGLLVTLEVNESGSFINGLESGKAVLQSLRLGEGNRVLFKLGVKKDAFNRGGFNLFGEKFGDYPQPIVFRSVFTEK
jgi:predicted transcriptional regulator